MATYTIDKIQYNDGDTYLLQDSGALQLTGGSVTGPVNFGNTVTMNEATLSELTISGAATIVNNLQVSSINGTQVGNTPKFTDTTYSALSNGGLSLNSSNAFSLANNYGDTKNPYASKTQNHVLATPSTEDGAPSFRALVTDDLPHDTEILNTATDDKIPTSLAVKKSLGYVTPQMFGGYGDGYHDDTDAIQTALDASLNVLLPAGTYLVSYPLFVRSGTHLEGASSGSTVLKVISSNFLAGVASLATTNPNEYNKYSSEIKNGTPFNCTNYPHPENWSTSEWNSSSSVIVNGYKTEQDDDGNTVIKIPKATGQNDIKLCRFKFLQEPEIGNYVIIVAEGIRAGYINQYNSSNNDSLYRPAFAGQTSTFLIQNFSINCNDTRTSGTQVAVGGLRIIRPYNKCAVRNVYVDNCSCRALYVGDEISSTYITQHYSYWKNMEIQKKYGDEDNLEEVTTTEQFITTILRRRTRSQTLVIDNCQFMGSDKGDKFQPSTSYYKSTHSTSSETSGDTAYTWRLINWRPSFYFNYIWTDITNVFTWGRDSGQGQTYGAVTAQTYNFSSSSGLSLNSAGRDFIQNGGTIQGYDSSTGVYTHNKIYVGDNTWLSYQTGSALCYIYNSFELNFKDTKVMYKSKNLKHLPCAIFNNCTDLYVRGCSFTGTLREAVKLSGGTKYFRLIGNTYEVAGVGTDSSGNLTGNGQGFATNGLHNLYRAISTVSPTQKITYADSQIGSSQKIEALYTESNYIINCQGLSATTSYTGKRLPIVGGLIFETTYNNTPREVKLMHTNDMFIMGTFKQLNTSTDDINTIIIGNLTGSIETNKFSTSNLYKSYSITTSTSSSVGGWTYLGSKALDTPTGMYPIGATVVSTSDARPAIAYISGSTLYVRSTSNNSFTVRVTFGK